MSDTIDKGATTGELVHQDEQGPTLYAVRRHGQQIGQAVRRTDGQWLATNRLGLVETRASGEPLVFESAEGAVGELATMADEDEAERAQVERDFEADSLPYGW